MVNLYLIHYHSSNDHSGENFGKYLPTHFDNKRTLQFSVYFTLHYFNNCSFFISNYTFTIIVLTKN